MRATPWALTYFATLTGLLVGACSTGSPSTGDDTSSGGSGGSMQGGGGGTAGMTLGGGAGKSGAGGANATGGASGTTSTQGGSGGGSGSATLGGTTGGGTMAGTGGTLAGSTSNGGAGAGGMNTGGDGMAGGAVAGGGGTSGDAGMAGMSGTGNPTGPCDIGGKILCDDFESTAAGMLPSTAPWAARNCFDASNTLKVDGAAHKSGAQSLLGMNIPYADCQLHADLGTSLGEYWVRAWVYYGTAAPTASTHEVTVFELVPAANTDDPSIRIGYRGDTCMPIGVELNITGGGQEETGCTGQTPVANTWYCYVLHVQQAASSVTTDLSIDGADQSYTNHGNPQTEITSQVANVRYLRVGPRSYSGNWANPIYLDDVAVATQQLGCQ